MLLMYLPRSWVCLSAGPIPELAFASCARRLSSGSPFLYAALSFSRFLDNIGPPLLRVFSGINIIVLEKKICNKSYGVLRILWREWTGRRRRSRAETFDIPIVLSHTSREVQI